MFGPSADILAGRNILICEIDDPAITAATHALFEASSANVTTVPLARHDQLMSYVLGLSHLSNLVFSEVLAASGEPFEDLRHAASTTFNAQLSVSLPVSAENRDLYYEIQAENGYTPQLLVAFERALRNYKETIQAKDHDAFCTLMGRAARYFSESGHG
jgi:prephenate dehydrogenase